MKMEHNELLNGSWIVRASEMDSGAARGSKLIDGDTKRDGTSYEENSNAWSSTLSFGNEVNFFDQQETGWIKGLHSGAFIEKGAHEFGQKPDNHVPTSHSPIHHVPTSHVPENVDDSPAGDTHKPETPDEDDGVVNIALKVADKTPPLVIAFTPADESFGAAVDTNIVMTFNEVVTKGTGMIEIHISTATGTVIESFNVANSPYVILSGGTTMTINPTITLSYDMHYYVTLGEGVVKDRAGNKYSGLIGYDFHTVQGDFVAPEVVHFSPADGGIEVAVDSNITLTFSEAITADSGVIEIHSDYAAGTLVESFDIATSSKVTISGDTLTIDPTADLLEGVHYYVTLANGVVEDLAGNNYAGTTSYDFKTVVAQGVPNPLTVISFTPADSSTGAEVGTNITVTFSEAIKAGTGTIEIHAGSLDGVLFESFDVVTSSHLSFSGDTLTIDPSSDLIHGTQYFVTFTPGSVLSLDDTTSYAGTNSYDFTTGAAPESWSSITGYGLLDVDKMLERATGQIIGDAPLYGDGYGSVDWGLNDIQAPDAWLAGYTGEGIVVAVIDTGVMVTHSDLAGQLWVNADEIAGNGIDDDLNGFIDDIHGFDFVNNDASPIDDQGHGTHVAGIIAGLRNGIGVTGVAYDASIMSVKVLDSTGSGSFSDVAAGILYAVNNGADVINLSLGGYGNTSIKVISALDYALSHGVIVCMAAGNESEDSLTFPAILAQTNGGIAVGALDSSNMEASFSNDAGTSEPFDCVMAPGVSIYSTYHNGGYVFKNGTSMATPFVAGAAALLLSAEADYSSAWTTEELENFLTASATPLGGAAQSSSAGTQTTAGAASSAEFIAEADAEFTGYYDYLHIEFAGVTSGVESGYEVHIV